MNKLAKNWKQRLKSYSSLSLIANILTALSVTGLSVLGVLSSEIALTTIITSALILGVLGLIGRVLDEAVDDGIVVNVSRGLDGYGWTITIKLYSGLYAFYAHLSDIRVKLNQKVKAGEIIALSGSTGNAKGMTTVSKGAHLHFEVRTAMLVGLGLIGRLNPLDYFDLDE